MADTKKANASRNTGTFVEVKALIICGYLSLIIYSNNAIKDMLTSALKADDIILRMGSIVYQKVTGM